VRPVNLIPIEQRRGAARGGGPRNPLPVYAVLGGLGAGVLCVLALVVTGNQINKKTGEIAALQAKSTGAKSVADSLRPYGQFATVQKARQTQIEQVVDNRFDWDHAVDQLARTTPPNVWLLTVSGTVAPGIEVESAGGDASKLRAEEDSPAFTLVGCTYSQRAVARMMARMNNLDGVTAVKLAKAARRDSVDSAAPAAPSAAANGTTDAEDCVGSSRVTKFELMVAFGASHATSSAAAAAGVPPSSAAQLGKAEGAAATVQSGSGAAATTSAAAPGGGQ
jgi:Tfp pilus assembly protein PilN